MSPEDFSLPHNAVAAKTHLCTSKTLGKNALKGEEVGGLFEYHQFAVSAIDDVVNGIASTLSFASGHNVNLKQ